MSAPPRNVLPSTGWRPEPVGWPARWIGPAVLILVVACAWSTFGLVDEVQMLRAGDPITWHHTGNFPIVVRALMPVAVLCIPLSFVFILWLRRSLKNVARRHLGAAGWLSRPSPQWWWLIPGVNLLAPLHVVTVLWRGTIDPSDPPGSTEWAARRVPVMLTVWWAGQVLVILAVLFVVWRQPPFEEMWSCVWNPVTERPQDCVLTAQGRAAWERSDGILAGMFVAQGILGLLFYRILRLLNSLQGRLLDATPPRAVTGSGAR